MNLRRALISPVTNPLAGTMLALFVRVALAAPFWLSDRTKVEDGTLFSIAETTYVLFENDYSGVPLPPHLAAAAATAAEHLLPIMLLLGIGTRAAAVGLLIMTMVIQLFVFPDAWWNVHMQWVALALTVIAVGPGSWSLDSLVFGKGPR